MDEEQKKKLKEEIYSLKEKIDQLERAIEKEDFVYSQIVSKNILRILVENFL